MTIRIAVLVMASICLMMLCSNSSKAENWSEIGSRIEKIEGGEIEVVPATDKKEYWVRKICVENDVRKVVIPSRINGYRITKLKCLDFQHKKWTLNAFGESFSIEDCKIDANNTNIEEIVLPNSIRSIGAYSFAGLTGLKKINIPKQLKKIKKWLFFDCDALKTITIPKNVKRIDFTAFWFKGDNVRIHIKKGNKSYVEKNGCILSANKKKLLFRSVFSKKVTIPKTVKDISGDVFWSAQKNLQIKRIELENGNRYLKIKKGCIYEKSAKRLMAVVPSNKGIVNVPKGVKVLGANVSSTTEVKRINIPKTVNTWEENWCHYLNSTNSILISIEGSRVPRVKSKYKYLAFPYAYYKVGKILSKRLKKYLKKLGYDFEYEKSKNVYYIS